MRKINWILFFLIINLMKISYQAKYDKIYNEKIYEIDWFWEADNFA
jgi:hypothetical protein